MTREIITNKKRKKDANEHIIFQKEIVTNDLDLVGKEKNIIILPFHKDRDVDGYKDIIIKLIPSEIVAAYTALVGIISVQDNSTALHWIILVVLLCFTFLYLNKINKIANLKQLIFTCLAFLIWAFSINPPYKGLILGYRCQLIVSILLILYTLLIPIVFIKSDT